MKQLLTIIGIAAGALTGAQAQVLFTQDFTAGGTTTTYVNSSSPTAGQWNAISTTGAAKVWSITSNALQLDSTGANRAYASRTTDFSPAPTVLQYSFTFQLISSSTALTSAIDIAIGSGFGTTNSSESGPNTYAKFAINTTASNGFVVRDMSGATNGPSTFTGAQTLTWVVNDSGISTAYLAPDGSTESLANNAWDLWVGSSKQLNDRSVTTASQAITDFKFGAGGNGTYSISFDDLSIQNIPEPKTQALISMASLVMLWNLRRKFQSQT